jgi:hypothetical protein
LDLINIGYCTDADATLITISTMTRRLSSQRRPLGGGDADIEAQWQHGGVCEPVREGPTMRASLIWALVPNVILDSPPVEPGESDELKMETLSAKRKFWCYSTHIIFGFFIAYLKGN